MSWYPEATQVPLPHFGYPKGTRGQNNILAVVHHIAEGHWATLIDPGFWATRNGGTGGSVHFAVSLAGEVVQFVDIADAAYGNGIVLNPSWKYAMPGNPNEKTVSIEHEGFTGNPWPEAQYQASKKLTDWILGRALIPANVDTVIGHYRIDSVNRASCPGSAWPIDRMLAELNAPPIQEDQLAGFTDEEKRALHELAALHLDGRTFAPGPPGRSLLIGMMDQHRDLKTDAGRDRAIVRAKEAVQRWARPYPPSGGAPADDTQD